MEQLIEKSAIEQIDTVMHVTDCNETIPIIECPGYIKPMIEEQKPVSRENIVKTRR